MNARTNSYSYSRIIEASERARFHLDEVFQGRTLDGDLKYLPDGLSLVSATPNLSEADKRWLSRIQGRTYANLFGLVERFINTKILELAGQHSLGDQEAVHALVRFSEEELKHQELFRRVEELARDVMPPGYRFVAQPNDVARLVLSKSSWSVLALTCHIELFTLLHYQESIAPDAALSPLWKDIFRFHFMEESQHARLDEMEWLREDARISTIERDRAVDDLIALVGAVDGILQAQSQADTEYFFHHRPRGGGPISPPELSSSILRAYRHQYVSSGIGGTRFAEILFTLITASQKARVLEALGPILG